MSPSRKSIVHAAFNKMDKEDAGVIPMSVLKWVEQFAIVLIDVNLLNNCFLARRFYNVKSNPRYVGGIETEEEIKKTFVDHFEEEDHVNAEVTREDFENYYAAVSGSCDDDTYFDLLIRQFYKL